MKKSYIFLTILFAVILCSNISNAVSQKEYINSAKYEISQYGEEKVATGLDPKNMQAQTILNNFTLLSTLR